MAKESKPAAEAYGSVVERLEGVVKRLEEGELSLEDSLKEFEEGIRLVRRGEKLLGEAERRVEELLQNEREDQVVPLLSEATRVVKTPARSVATGADDDDVPF